MNPGRPSTYDQRQIKNTLRAYYQKGISANATSNHTGINIKTILKYFKTWDEKIANHDEDFLKKAKIAKHHAINTLDYEIISLEEQEKEIESMKNFARDNGSLIPFEKLTKLKLKIAEQKLKTISAKVNLINTPTADVIVNMEKENGN